jgi:transposase
MSQLNASVRENALGRLQAGQSQSEVARALRVSQSTISRLWHRFQQTGSSAPAPRSGRPRVTTQAQDRYIRVTHLRHRFQSASVTARALPGGRRISVQTVRNRLHTTGLHAYRPLRGNVLTRRHCQARMQWANQHLQWTLANNWRHVVFSDESYFLLQHHDSRRRVYRRQGERYHQQCVDEAPPHGGGGVMVWGAITNTGRSQLVEVPGRLNAQHYVQDILQPHALPLLAAPRAQFQHDNARPHTARLTTNFLAANNVNTLPWPSLSPDLNPIEHAWDELGRRLNARVNAPPTRRQLFQALQQEWDNIPQPTLQRLIASMPRRCQAVIDSRGSHTRY